MRCVCVSSDARLTPSVCLTHYVQEVANEAGESVCVLSGNVQQLVSARYSANAELVAFLRVCDQVLQHARRARRVHARVCRPRRSTSAEQSEANLYC